ncbi:MAG TPA: hypothetical protein VF039_03575 [Longimicrobiales bacterium]
MRATRAKHAARAALLACAAACAAYAAACAGPAAEATGDRQVFDERVAVFLLADSAALDAARAQHGEEDFYVVADDMNWYRAEAADWLEQNGIRTVFLEGRPELSFIVGDEPAAFNFDAESTLDVVVLYSPGRMPIALAPVDVGLRAPTYFGINDTTAAQEP